MGRYSGKTCRLLFMLVLTAAFFVAELVSGYVGNSIALLSDSFNMLSDLISLCVGLGAGYVARRPRGGLGATYGYARAEVLGALSNAVFLTALCFTIAVEAVLRLARPERIDDPERHRGSPPALGRRPRRGGRCKAGRAGGDGVLQRSR